MSHLVGELAADPPLAGPCLNAGQGGPGDINKNLGDNNDATNSDKKNNLGLIVGVVAGAAVAIAALALAFCCLKKKEEEEERCHRPRRRHPCRPRRQRAAAGRHPRQPRRQRAAVGRCGPIAWSGQRAPQQLAGSARRKAKVVQREHNQARGTHVICRSITRPSLHALILE